MANKLGKTFGFSTKCGQNRRYDAFHYDDKIMVGTHANLSGLEVCKIKDMFREAKVFRLDICDEEEYMVMDTRDKPEELPTERLRRRACRARKMVFLEYDKLDKGVIAGEFSIVDLAIPILLEDTSTELKRLYTHPELLPAGTNLWFFQDMKHRLRCVLKHVNLQDSAHEKQRLKARENMMHYRKEMLPAYDDHRTLWQQFLHDQAPGSGFPKDQIDPRGHTQMITAAPVLMATNKIQERDAYFRALEEGINPNQFNTLKRKRLGFVLE
ncbi:MAG: hypothetical protein Q9220_006843 [cf. Caloplaca sp. 1 TL-2023]